MRLASLCTAALVFALAPLSIDADISAPFEFATRANEEVIESWPDGTPRRVYEVDDQGRRQGSYVEYRIHGELLVRARYDRGLLSGRYESFHPSGERNLDVRYAKGLLDGRYQEFDEQGKRLVTGKYSKGQKDGAFEIRRDGDVVSQQDWRDGRLTKLDGLENPVPRSREEVASDLLAIERLAIEPILKSEDEGAIEPELAAERIAALKRLMEYRALSSLPYADMQLDPKFNWHCSWAAKMLVILGHLDHTPKNPGMPEADYRAAYTGTSSSNLSMGPGLAGSIDSYMDDSDDSNVDRVGHRRWCLNPAMKRTGFGISEKFSAMWSFDESRPFNDWEYVAYPAFGYYPADHIVDGAAWSVRFRRSDLEGLKESDLIIEIYALDENYARGAPMRLDHTSIYSGQIIFRGVDVVCAPGRAYEVRISKAGKRTPELMLRYFVEFTDLGEILTAARAGG